MCEAESIDCDFVKGGRLSVATTASQLDRLRESVAAIREWGDGDDVYEFLSPAAVRARVNVAGALAGLYAPASARIQPAALAAGIAAAAERRGVDIYEATPVTAIEPCGPPGGSGAGAVARTKFGDVRARSVLRCTEGYTASLPGLRRALLPMNSHMIVTEPLSPQAWQEIGWNGAETLGDEAHAYMYAQRTADGRIALGGRGVPYRFGSGVDQLGQTDPATVAALTDVLRRMFPAAGSAPIAHAWCGVLGVPRDWCATVTYNPASGLGWAGGYTGVGVAAVQPGRTDPGRPGAGRAVAADGAAVGRPPKQVLGARAGPVGRRAGPLRALPAGRPARVARRSRPGGPGRGGARPGRRRDLGDPALTCWSGQAGRPHLRCAGDERRRGAAGSAGRRQPRLTGHARGPGGDPVAARADRRTPLAGRGRNSTSASGVHPERHEAERMHSAGEWLHSRTGGDGPARGPRGPGVAAAHPGRRCGGRSR